MQNRKANNVGEGKGGVPLQMVEYGEKRRVWLICRLDCYILGSAGSESLEGEMQCTQ